LGGPENFVHPLVDRLRGVGKMRKSSRGSWVMRRRHQFTRQIQRVTTRNELLLSDLWTLTRYYPSIDPGRLARAVEASIESGERLDFRTRLLIRDSVRALERHWGQPRLARWLRSSPARQRLEAIRREDLGEVGFPSLEVRIMTSTDPDRVKMFLRDLGDKL